MAIERFEDLEVWRAAHELVLRTYKLTRSLPAEERFGLCSQMRRAAVSVPANIAEGFKRRRSGDKARFYNIASASLQELRYYLILCRDLDYIDADATDHALLASIAKMLHRLEITVTQR